MFQNWCLRVICFCALLNDTAVCTQTFYKLVSSADGASVTDQNIPFLTQSFFTCGSNEDCTKVVKFKRSKPSEVIHQAAIKADAIVYEKINTPKTDGKYEPLCCLVATTLLFHSALFVSCSIGFSLFHYIVSMFYCSLQ